MEKRIGHFVLISLLAHTILLFMWRGPSALTPPAFPPVLSVLLETRTEQHQDRVDLHAVRLMPSLAPTIHRQQRSVMAHTTKSRIVTARRQRHTADTKSIDQLAVSAAITPKSSVVVAAPPSLVTAQTPSTKSPTDVRSVPPAPGDDTRMPLAERLQVQLHLALQAHFQYPLVARRKGWQGLVKLALRIEPDGRLSDIRVAQPSGYALLDDAALASARRIPQLTDAVNWLRGASFEIVLPIEYRLIDG